MNSQGAGWQLIAVEHRGPRSNRGRLLKVCSRCGKMKPPGEFYARQDRPGDRPHCRACQKELARSWQQMNPERANLAKRAYRKRNREADRERSRLYRAKLKDARA